MTKFFGLAALVCFHVNLFAQPNRINKPIDDGHRFTIRGSLHRLATSEYDQGRAESYLRIERLTLVLKPSEAQAAELDGLLGELQYPKSKNYHQWLTPDLYADRFGLSGADIEKISDWLSAQGLSVTGVSRARNAIMARGSVEQIENTFQTEIHMYAVAGEIHYANATEPKLPTALEGIVVAIHGLHDFRLRPRTRMLESLLPPEPQPGDIARNLPPGPPPGIHPQDTPDRRDKHQLTPEDFAKIFGTIQPPRKPDTEQSVYRIAIAGQSQIDPSHVADFRRRFDLGDVQFAITVVPNSLDPGTRSGDDQQSELDLAWASAVMPESTLFFFYSDDVMDAVQYAVDQNVAPILGMSYGECLTSSATDVQTMRTWAKQASAQGIRWVSGSGDSGAGGCYQSTQ